VAHTPGPWIVHFKNYEGYGIRAQGRGCISERWWPVQLSESDNDEMRSNARLIASAPDLLAVAKRLCDVDTCDCDTKLEQERPCVVCQAREALRKAGE
jgi:hypothetical protein